MNPFASMTRNNNVPATPDSIAQKYEVAGFGDSHSIPTMRAMRRQYGP